MTIALDERAMRDALAPLLDAPEVRAGLENLARDPFFLAFFLMSVSQGEGLGEAAVGMVRQEEVAELVLDLRRQEAEEKGHKEVTSRVALELFPEFFDDGGYRYRKALRGAPYYVAVLDANRARLRAVGRYSRLNLYLTTTFGYEVMVLLLYQAVARAVEASHPSRRVRDRVVAVLEGILREEETHLDVADQHRALLAADRGALSSEARSLLDALEPLGPGDYAFAAELSVREVVRTMADYADPVRYRAEIEASAA